MAPQHCYPDGPYRSGQQMRVWHYWVLGGSPYLISGPFYRLILDGCNLSYFMDECQRSWCKRASSHMCTAQRLAFAILRVTHLIPWPQFYEGMHFHRNQLQSSAELLKLSNFRVVTYSLYFKLRLFWLSWIFYTTLCAQTTTANIEFVLSFITCGCCGALAELCQTNTDTSRVKYSLAVILAFLTSFWICHGGCTQGWLSV